MIQKLASYLKPNSSKSSNYFLLFVGILIVVFFLSEKLVFYGIMKPHLGVLNAYLLDQSLFPVLFAITLTVSILKKRIKLISLRSVFFFLLYVAFTLITLWDILDRYFIHDDLTIMLSNLTSSDGLAYGYEHGKDFFYYHFFPFSLLFKLFHLNVFYYNLFSLVMMALSAILFLQLLTYLNKIHNFNNKTLPVFITLVYLISPTIMESFTYVGYSVTTGSVVALIVSSLYFYMKFLNQKTKKLFFFVLAYLLILICLKTAMVRAGFWPISIALLEMLYWPKDQKERLASIFRTGLILLPFLFMVGPFLGLDSPQLRFDGIGISRFFSAERIYLFFANLIPEFVSYQFWEPVYKFLHMHFVGQEHTVSNYFILRHLFFTGGLIFFVVFSVTTVVLFLKRKGLFLIPFFWFCSVLALAFFMLFGNVAVEKGFLIDSSFLAYTLTPGSRYYPIPFVFLLTAFYLLLARFITKYNGRLKNLISLTPYFIIVFVIISDLKFVKIVNHNVSENMKPSRVVSEKILSMVPDDSQKKVLYSTNGDIRQGVNYFYKPLTLNYISDKEELLRFLKKNTISEKNFYAFYFNPESLQFEDRSTELKQEFSNYLNH